MAKRREIERLPSNFIKYADDYETIEVIGGGQYGTVEKVKEKATNKIFAKKIIPVEEGDELGAPLYFIREFFSLLSIHYSGLPILQLEACRLPENNKPGFIITEYIEGGSLENLINKRFKHCDDVPTTKMIIIFGIAVALKFLHKFNLVHRDLKPANILLDKNKKPFLADFGFARDIANIEIMTGKIGSYDYMAPELFVADEIEPDKSIDVYSFAVLTLEILAGTLKMNGKPTTNAFNKKILKGKRFDIPETVPKCFVKMINDCWSGNPSQRWTMDKVVQKMASGKVVLPETDMDAYNEYVQDLMNKLDTILKSEEEEEEEEEVEATPEFNF